MSGRRQDRRRSEHALLSEADSLCLEVASQPKDLLDVRRLGIHIGLTILKETRGQNALHVGELAFRCSMGAQIVAKGEIVAPQGTAFFNQVHVKRPRLSSAKILPARHPSLASVVVAGLCERGNVILD